MLPSPPLGAPWASPTDLSSLHFPIFQETSKETKGVRAQQYEVLRSIREGHLVPLLEDWESPIMPISVLYWPSRHLSAKVRVFVDFISEVFAKQVPHLKPVYGRGG